MKINGTLQHLALGFIAALISLLAHASITPAVWALIAVELTQAESTGWRTAWRHFTYADTWLDLFADALGLLLAYALYRLLI